MSAASFLANSDAAIWHVTLFGTLCASDPDGICTPVTHFRTQRTAALLAFLTFHKGQHSREVLGEMLWPGAAPDKARTRLKQEIATLRRLLEPETVEPESVLYAEDRAHIGLRSGSVVSDIAAFEALLRQADAPHTDADAAQNALHQAVRLHGGAGLLPGRYEEWVEGQRERLALLYAHALQRIALFAADTVDTADTANAAPGAGVVPAEAWDAAHRALQAAPYEEASHAALIRLYLATHHVSKARAQFAHWERIADEEGAAPPSRELRRLVDAGAPRLASPVVPAPTPRPLPPVVAPPVLAPARLPARLTPFFDREKEIRLILDAVWNRRTLSPSEPPTRLLTITGPGGMGKTRLSLEIAHLAQAGTKNEEPVRAAFAPLAGVSDAALLWDTVLASVFPHAAPSSGMGGAARNAQAQLIHLLEQARLEQARPPNGRVLLVLDNFEQIAEGGAELVAEFLQNAPWVLCLVTSRQKLHLHGEREISLAPLPLPGSENAHAGQADPAPSVRLFADRVKADLPDFSLTNRNAEIVGDICLLLHGIPLALELAAARVGVLGLAPLRDTLKQNLLEPLVSRRRDLAPRHRTLRNTIAWSFDLLPPDARRLFTRLSVFRSGWTLQAAQAVGDLPTDADALAGLEILRDHHLITSREHEGTGETRFFMLEILRQWAAERLPPGELTNTNERFVGFYLNMTQKADLELRGEREAYWIARLDAEHDNLRAALVWAVRDVQARPRDENDPLCDAALRFCDELAQYWWLKGHLSEGRKWYEDALAASPDHAAPRITLTDALRSCASLVLDQGDNDAGRELAARSLDMARLIGHRRCEAYANGTLARAAIERGEYETARQHLERGKALFALYDPKPGYIQNMEAIQRHNLGITLLALSDPHGARTCFEETMAYWRSKGMVHRSQIADSLEALGHLEWLENRPDMALHLLHEAVALRRSMKVKGGLSQTLLMLARIFHLLEPLAARPYLREGLLLAHEIGHRRDMVEAIEEIAVSVFTRDRPQEAAQLWGMASALRQQYPDTLRPSPYRGQAAQETLRARARETLGAAWEMHEAKGRALVLSSALPDVVRAALAFLDTEK